MYLIKADEKMADLQNILDQAEFENGKVRISVPKFKVEHSAVLDNALKAMELRPLMTVENRIFQRSSIRLLAGRSVFSRHRFAEVLYRGR